MLNILIISDEAKSIASLFKSTGYTPDTRDMKQQAKRRRAATASSDKYDIAFLDLDTENWQQRLLDVRHSMPVIAFSLPDLNKAVEAMKLGASDYLEKPLTAEVLSEVIGRHKKQILSHKYGFDEIIGISMPMQEVFGLIKKAAASESNVLITGESGTGKELIARAIHRWSPRSEKSFMTINCSAIPDTLLESELFGFEKGSFTGAQYMKKGLLEQADGGTVFFDEIGDVSPLFQTKVLRVLQEGEIMRIGGMRQIRVDLRFITATNRDLKIACQRGIFREDLFYRLNVINIHLPPLRERMEDVALLAKHFVQKHAHKRKDVLIKVHQRRGAEPSAGPSLSRERAGTREHHRTLDLFCQHLRDPARRPPAQSPSGAGTRKAPGVGPTAEGRPLCRGKRNHYRGASRIGREHLSRSHRFLVFTGSSSSER